MIRQLLKWSFEDFEVQTVLTFEMIIDGCLIDASFGDDVPHARTIEASLCEQINGSLDNGVAGRVGLGGRPLPNNRGRRRRHILFSKKRRVVTRQPVKITL